MSKLLNDQIVECSNCHMSKSWSTFVYESRLVFPRLVWPVNSVHEREATRVFSLNILDLLAQQNVLLGLVGVEQPNARRLFRLEDIPNDLQHGRNSRTTSDQTQVSNP